jgi:hypothetical protein
MKECIRVLHTILEYAFSPKYFLPTAHFPQALKCHEDDKKRLKFTRLEQLEKLTRHFL